MRTVTYLTPRSFARNRATARVGSVILRRARSHWMSSSELPMVRRVALYHPALPPGFEGLRIVQVSDVHAGHFMPPDRLERVRELIETLAPQLVVFTGDQLDRREVDAELFVHGFAGVAAPLGAFGILGNHDHLAGPELAVAALEAAGITPLVNSATLLQAGGARLLLAGVDDPDGRGSGPDFRILTRTPADFRLLLCHQPRSWPGGWAAGADITLAGHTHGGQIAFPTRILNPARLMTQYVVGPYQRDGSILYVSRGVGVGAVPFRFGAPPELDLITLHRGLARAA
jgi:predicted MPP superfamily phosphohydrolase